METSEKTVQTIEDILRDKLSGCACDADTFGRTDSSEFTSYSELACKLFDVFRAHYDVPVGLLEIRGTAKKYTAEGGKEIQIVVSSVNSLDNLITLARLGAGSNVTLRGIESDIETASESTSDDESDNEHPDQMHIDEAVNQPIDETGVSLKGPNGKEMFSGTFG